MTRTLSIKNFEKLDLQLKKARVKEMKLWIKEIKTKLKSYYSVKEGEISYDLIDFTFTLNLISKKGNEVSVEIAAPYSYHNWSMGVYIFCYLDEETEERLKPLWLEDHDSCVYFSEKDNLDKMINFLIKFSNII